MIHVFGHIHPDSDAICTAVVTAYWLTQRGYPATAWRLGEANRETRYIFDTAGLSLPPRLTMPLMGKSVWLVDFSEPQQGPADLAQSTITGIIDHHRLGGLVTQLPPEVTVRPLGSSATVLWMLMPPEMRQTLPAAYAALLSGAVLSDTVDLRSPTTTADDIRAVGELITLSGIPRATFTRDLLRAKTDLSGLSASTLLNRDLKAFVIAGVDVRIAQIEIGAIGQISPLVGELRRGLSDLAAHSGAGLAVLMITDITAGFSTLYFAGPHSGEVGACSVPGMLSRKKQLLPWLASRLHVIREAV